MARRKTETFSMSFLDVISCGFGAVVLFYTIMSQHAGMQRTNERMNLAANANRVEQEVEEGRRHLAELAQCPGVDRGPHGAGRRPIARGARTDE